MVKRVSSTALAAAVAAAVALPTLVVPDQALAISRGVKQPDGMVCREIFGKVHYHNGRNWRVASSRSAALSAAINRWVGFTRFEYGSRWASWGVARRKSVNCSNSQGGWQCQVKAQPCRR